jgi:hypothetical protein
MRKRVWTIAVSLAALGILGVGYLYLSSRPKPPPPVKEDPAIQLWEFDKEKLVKVTLSDRPEGVLIAEKRGIEWKLNYAYPILLNEFSLDQLKYTFSDLKAERILEEKPTDLAKYGLAPPRARAEAALDDGTTKRFSLGDPAPNGDTYYFQVQGDERLYSVWKTVGEHLHWTVADLREKKIKPAIYSDEINYLLLRLRDGSEFELRRKTEEERNNFTLGSGKYVITKPYRSPRGVDADKAVTFIRGTAAIEIAGFVNDAPKDLTPYGLDRPWCETIVRDKAITQHILFGAETEGDKVYFKFAENPSVYTVDRIKLAYLGVKPFDIVDRRVFYPELDTVDRIEIASAGKTRVFTIVRTKNDNGEIFATYRMDGRNLEEQAFAAFYLAISGLAIDGLVKDPKALEPFVRMRFLLNKGAPREVIIEYMPYSRDFYAMFLNGKSEFAVSTVQLAAMVGAMDRLVAAEKITP